MPVRPESVKTTVSNLADAAAEGYLAAYLRELRKAKEEAGGRPGKGIFSYWYRDSIAPSGAEYLLADLHTHSRYVPGSPAYGSDGVDSLDDMLILPFSRTAPGGERIIDAIGITEHYFDRELAGSRPKNQGEDFGRAARRRAEELKSEGKMPEGCSVLIGTEFIVDGDRHLIVYGVDEGDVDAFCGARKLSHSERVERLENASFDDAVDFFRYGRDLAVWVPHPCDLMCSAGIRRGSQAHATERINGDKGIMIAAAPLEEVGAPIRGMFRDSLYYANWAGGELERRRGASAPVSVSASDAHNNESVGCAVTSFAPGFRLESEEDLKYALENGGVAGSGLNMRYAEHWAGRLRRPDEEPAVFYRQAIAVPARRRYEGFLKGQVREAALGQLPEIKGLR